MGRTAPQSTSPLLRLPAFLTAFLFVALPALQGQNRMRVGAETQFRREASGTVLGTFPAGRELVVRRTDGGWAEVRLEGWVFSRSLARTDREGFDLMVSPGPENIREAPNGRIVGRLAAGTLLRRVEDGSGWTRVRRDVWIPRSALQGAATARRDTAPAAPAGPGGDGGAPAAGERIEAVGPVRMLVAPDGDTVGALHRGTQARVLSRSGEWVRVQVEGWVRQGEVRTAVDTSVLVGVSAAEVRAAPDRFVGRTVEWRVQYLSLQRADELRPEIPEGRPYLLTRGPLPEVGFVYVIIPPADLQRYQALTPLQELTLRVRIRAASTRYLPNPVVELVAVVEAP